MVFRLAFLCLLLLTIGGCASAPPHHQDALSSDSAHPGSDQTIGTSVQGRAILARTLCSGSPRLLIIGGIHGDEREGGAWIDNLSAHLAASHSPQRGPGIRVILDLNPDGTAARTRANARGIDLNRNLPSANFKSSASRGKPALSEPESAALVKDLNSYEPDVVMVIHSAKAGPFVNFDGPAAGLAAAFADAAASKDPRWRIVNQMGYATPGSLGSFVGVDRGIPILTIEFAKGHKSDMAREALLAGTTAVVNAMCDPRHVVTVPH